MENSFTITLFTQMQAKAFSLYLALKCARLAKPDCSELDPAEQNQGLHHQMVTCQWTREDSTAEGNWNNLLLHDHVHNLIF